MRNYCSTFSGISVRSLAKFLFEVSRNMQSDEAQHLPCTALQPWRASFVQQVLSPAGARQQAASAAGCLLCSKSGATSNSIPISITRRCTPPCGLHLRSNAFAQQRNSPHSLPVALLQQVCIRIQLHLPLFTAKCRTPALKGFVCTTLRTARRQNTSSNPHPRPTVPQSQRPAFAVSCIYHSSPPEHTQQSAFAPSCSIRQQVVFYAVSLYLHPTPYRSALPGAALRPEGLRLHKSAFAAKLVSSATALATLKEAHLIQQPAFAASCILPAPCPHCACSDLAAACLCWTAFQRLLRLQKSTSRNSGSRRRL